MMILPKDYDKFFDSLSISPPCFIYMIESTSKHYKIGISKDPSLRFRQLTKTQGPYEYKLIGYAPCISVEYARKEEKWVHDMLKNYRVNGEWFTPSPEMLFRIGVTFGDTSATYARHVGRLLNMTDNRERNNYFEAIHGS